MARLSMQSIQAVQKVITGDAIETGCSFAPYQKGWELERFFKQFASNPKIEAGLGSESRWKFCEDCLLEMNGTAELDRVIEVGLDPRRFHETDFSADAAADYLNGFLSFDDVQVSFANGRYRLRDTSDLVANVGSTSTALDPASRVFVDEQIQKCQEKLESSDFDGAITNARSMIESVLLSLEKKSDGTPPKYDGNLPRLFKRVRKQLNLDPNESAISDVLKPILTGLSSVVDGISGMRNSLSDAHAPQVSCGAPSRPARCPRCQHPRGLPTGLVRVSEGQTDAT